MFYFVFCLFPVATATDNRSFDQIVTSINTKISRLGVPLARRRLLDEPSFFEGMRSQIAKGENPVFDQGTLYFDATLGLDTVFSIRRLLLHPIRRHIFDWSPLKRLMGSIAYQYEKRETQELVAQAKAALLGLDALVGYPLDEKLAPTEMYAIMYELASYPPMLQKYKLSEVRAKQLLIESLARAYESSPETEDARPHYVLSAIQSLRGSLSNVPLSVPADPEGIPFEPSTKLYFSASSSENPIQALASLRYLIQSKLDDVSPRSTEQRAQERIARIESRELLMRDPSVMTLFPYPEKKRVMAQKRLRTLLSALNQLEMKVPEALGRWNITETVMEMVHEAETLYTGSGSQDDKEVALQALSGLLNALKFPLSEGNFTDFRLNRPLDFMEIISLFWKCAGSPELKRQVLECVAVFDPCKPQYANNSSLSIFTEENYFGRAFRYRILDAWSSLFYTFFPHLATSVEENAFQVTLGSVSRANMYRLSLNTNDLLQKIRSRAPERFLRAKGGHLSPLQEDINVKMSLIECIPLYLSEAQAGGIGDYVPEEVFVSIEALLEASSDERKKIAMDALAGLDALFKYSITEQVFSPKRLSGDPVLLLDFYRVAFAFLGPEAGKKNEQLLETCLLSLGAFKGTWGKEWESPAGCPVAVLDAFNEFLDAILSHLSSRYCQSAASPDEWAFAARLPWVEQQEQGTTGGL